MDSAVLKEPCTTIMQFGSNLCELTNNQTLTIELVAALLITSATIILAAYFFWAENKRTKIDVWKQIVRDKEHSIEIMTLEIQARNTEKLLEEATKTLEKIEPIIENQERILQEKEKEEKTQQENILKNLAVYLNTSKKVFLMIKASRDDRTMSH